MFELRYYGQRGGNREIMQLLRGIEDKHKVAYQVISLLGQKQEKQVYERDSKPRARILGKRTGKPITKLRGAGGERHYYVSNPGTIAIVRNAQVEWWTFTDRETTDFLTRVLSEGQVFLEKLCI